MRIKNNKIAQLAGVSPATVSRVINGSGVVSENMRQRVMEILRQQQNDPTMPDRRSNLKHTIGFLTLHGGGGDPSDTLCKLAEISECGRLMGFNVMYITSHISPSVLETMYYKHDIDGLFIVGYGENSPKFADMLTHIPYVWLNSHETGLGEKSIMLGDELAGRLAAEYLLKRHCQRIGCLHISSINPGLAARLAGAQYAFFSNGIKTIELKCEFTTGKYFESCKTAELEEALAPLTALAISERCDGIFIPAERLTAAFHRNLMKSGILPQDFPRIITCDCSKTFLEGLYPRPATVDMKPFQNARLAVEKLMKRLNNDTGGDNLGVVISPEIIPGEF